MARIEARTFPCDHPEVAGITPPNGSKWYTCHFSNKYLDFRQAELESVAALYGCDVQDIVWRQPPRCVRTD